MSKAYRDAGLKDGDLKAQARFCEVKDFGKSLASQSEAAETDINRIMARVAKGQVILSNAGEPFYGDVSAFEGLQDSLIKVQDANALFMQFPWNVRERFHNDPVEFVDFMSDPKNVKEAIDLGLAVAKPVPAVPEPPVGAPVATEPSK